MLQLIAVDVDGTLVNSRGVITAPVREAIHRLTYE